MSEKSENPETIAEKEPTNTEKESTVPEKDEEPPPQPKARGRPKGAKDNKPRIKGVPIQREEGEPPPPRVKAVKKVEVQPKEKEPPETPEEPTEEEEEEEPPPPKSPRSLHRERVQQAAMERRKQARDRQEHFKRILDNFMGF